MNVRPIRNEADYDAALEKISVLFASAPGTPEADKLEVLVTLAEAYEAQHYTIPAPDPIEAIEHEMERQGLSPRDLEPYVGTRTRVWEILNRRRPLTLRMIRKLSAGLGIPTALLVQEYELAATSADSSARHAASTPAMVAVRESNTAPYQRDTPGN